MSRSLARYHQALQQTTLCLWNIFGNSKGTDHILGKGKPYLQYFLQISFMTKQNQIHVWDNNNQMEVYKVFYVCDVI